MAPVKIRVALPSGDLSGGTAEWLWAEPVGDGRFLLKNIPIFAFGLSCEDTVIAESHGGTLDFDGIAERGGHSTYRLYLKSDRNDNQVIRLLETLGRMQCEKEVATEKIIGVDVPPSADIYQVYELLEKAEAAGILEFEEGHCGHALKK